MVRNSDKAKRGWDRALSPGWHCPRAGPGRWRQQPCLALSPFQTPIFQPGEVCRARAMATLTQSVNKNQLNNDFLLEIPGGGGGSGPALPAIKKALAFFSVDAKEELRGDPAPAQPHRSLREQEQGTDIRDNTNPWMSHSCPWAASPTLHQPKAAGSWNPAWMGGRGTPCLVYNDLLFVCLLIQEGKFVIMQLCSSWGFESLYLAHDALETSVERCWSTAPVMLCGGRQPVHLDRCHI